MFFRCEDPLEFYYCDKLDIINGSIPAIKNLTPRKIQSVLKKIVSQGNVIEVVMSPEN